jgi:hypothetical protein
LNHLTQRQFGLFVQNIQHAHKIADISLSVSSASAPN